MPSIYGWIITKDHLAASLGNDRTGVVGPRNILSKIEARLKDGEGRVFRMLDSDGEVYYEGRIVSPPPKWGGEWDFTPLVDLGMPDAGCSDIQYLNAQGEWESL